MVPPTQQEHKKNKPNAQSWIVLLAVTTGASALVAAVFIGLYVNAKNPPIARSNLPGAFLSKLMLYKSTRYNQTVMAFSGDLVSSHFVSNHGWEAGLMAKIAPYITSNSTVLDIGANIGASTVELYHKMRATEVTFQCFEMQIDVSHVLAYNVRHIPHAKVYAGGLNATNAAVEYSPQHTGNIGGTSVGGVSMDKKAPTVSVASFCMCDIRPPTPVSLVKIDIEGFESVLFDGAANMTWWREHTPSAVCIELFAPKFDYVATKLDELGYVHAWSDKHDHFFMYSK
jgi:FkbM family methyltransferase